MRYMAFIITLVFAAGFIAVGQGLAGEGYGQRMGAEHGAEMMGESQKMGMHSLDHNQVREMQKILSQKGHDAGPADGLMGPKTKRALRSFQESEGLAVTGQPDKDTLQALAPDAETQEFFGLSPEYGEEGMQKKEMMQDQMEKEGMMHDREMEQERMREHMDSSY